jgi:small subunit ribosomal protein S14
LRFFEDFVYLFLKLKKNIYLNSSLIDFMAKKSMIERQKKRQRLVLKYAEKRASLKEQLKTSEFLEEKVQLSRKLQQIPRDSSATRLHNRCFITGRPKGFFRDFGLSRHCLREMAHEGLLPGITKASW